MAKVYKEGTPLHIMLEDGWAQGLEVEQCLSKITEMEIPIDLATITRYWELMDIEYTVYLEHNHIRK